MNSAIKVASVNNFRSLKIAFFTLLCFIGGWIAVTVVIFPLQTRFLYFADIASILFLPHGVRIISTWLAGARAILPLTLAEIIAASTVWGWAGLHSNWSLLAASFVGGISAYATFWIFNMAGISCSIKDHGVKLWRVLLLVAVGASVINSIGKAVFLGAAYNPIDTTKVIGTFMFGDVAGAAICLFIMLFVFRVLRRSNSDVQFPNLK